MWEARSCHLDRYEFICRCTSWGIALYISSTRAWFHWSLFSNQLALPWSTSCPDVLPVTWITNDFIREGLIKLYNLCTLKSINLIAKITVRMIKLEIILYKMQYKLKWQSLVVIWCWNILFFFVNHTTAKRPYSVSVENRTLTFLLASNSVL